MMSTRTSEQAAKKLGIMMSSRSSSNGQAAKRLIIRNLKVAPRNEEDNFLSLWKHIDEAVRAIHESRPVSMSLELLYQSVENICAEKKSSMLYSALRQLCEEHIRREVPKLTLEMNDQIEYLKLLNRHWEDHCSHMVMICQIFLPLDRGYVLNNPLILSIWDLGLDLFKNYIIINKTVQTRCISGLLTLIDSERSGELIDRSLVKSLLTMLYKLQLYQPIFETEFIKSSEKLYSHEGESLLQTFEIPEYLKHVEKRLNEENNRLLHYLHPSTRQPLINCVERNLIGEHVNTILQKGFDNLMDDKRLDDLKLLYNLLSRFLNGVEQLKNFYSQYIKKRGRDIVINPEKDNTMIQELLDFKEKLDLISECWNNNEKFTHALKDSFEHFINQRSNKPAELIAKYIDTKLRAGNKEATEEELDKILDKIMVLFRFIHGKDVFEAFYKKDLAKRLLVGKSASVDAEKSMLSKLKQECGGVFTLKLEGMFKDMELSKDVMSAFEQQLQIKTSLSIYVNVLTLTHWPSYTASNIILPPEMSQLQEKFTEFYKKKYSGRNLQWQPSLGHCLVKGHISPGNNKEFQLSLYQTLVLLLYNAKDDLSYEEIFESTKIEENELKRTLQSLACGKVPILTKSSKGVDVHSEDIFKFNKSFTHKLYRIRINQVQLKETQEENQSTNEKVFQDRQYQVDAAIVRIMKMRKSLPHNLLVTEVVGQLKFSIKPADIKKRIESLIERDYLARDEQNPNQYNYLA
ncbi:unnamed protein product [Brachionus calyciflorus]|uniref:Cullin-4 n=1 Tax=Brachionus calyciflorus TaxID=104777 RepID=A0A813V9U5_9BILA|nr:unnamed protein product [Brachionus calyciflorus]